MVKTKAAVKEIELKAQIEVLIKELFARVPFVALESFQSETAIFQDPSNRPDWLAEVRIRDEQWALLVEAKPSGQPRIIRNGMFELESYLRQLPQDKPCYGVLIAPFISTTTANICAKAGIGYLDLAGNAYLNFDQVFIDIRTAQNPFKESRELRSIFTPKAGRILRALLTPPLRSWKVEELAAETDVSLGHVSNVRKRLIDQEWAQAGDAGLRLTKPVELARAWQNAYKPRPRERDQYHTVLHGEELETAFRKAFAATGAGEHAVLASYSAARWIAPYARQATHFFYADDIGKTTLQKYLQLEYVTQGANIVIEEPREDDVFIKRLEPAPGIWCSGLVQTWLDLNATGERGREAAEHLLQHKLLPEWKDLG